APQRRPTARFYRNGMPWLPSRKPSRLLLLRRRERRKRKRKNQKRPKEHGTGRRKPRANSETALSNHRSTSESSLEIQRCAARNLYRGLRAGELRLVPGAAGQCARGSAAARPDHDGGGVVRSRLHQHAGETAPG